MTTVMTRAARPSLLRRRGVSRVAVAPSLASLAVVALAACGPATQTGSATATDGSAVTYAVAGTGPAVILVGDSNATTTAWTSEFKRFAGSFRVARIDGTATPASLVAVLDSLQVRAATVIALGRGAATALTVARTHPDRVEALVLVSPHLDGTDPTFAPYAGPTLLVTGTVGDPAGARGIDSLRAHLGTVSTVTIPGGGHAVPTDHAKAFTGAVLEFLYKNHPEALPHER
jgi:pimeloyl-ACP methyl ester carboxylesterase